MKRSWKRLLFGWEHRILLKESKVRITNKPSHDNSAVSEWKGELYNANLYIDLHKFPQRIKVKRIFLNFSLVFFFLNKWHFLSLRRRRSFWRNVPSGKVHWRNDCIGRLGGLSASVSFLSSPPISHSFKKESLLAGYLSRNARPNKSGEDEKRRTDIVRTCVTRQKRLRGRLSCPCSIDPQYGP